MKEKCEGCQIEMEECYYWQSKGFDAGLNFSKGYGIDNKIHCLVFVLDEKGEFIIE